MQTISPPVKQYTTGKLPTHSALNELSTHFAQIPQAIIESALTSKAYLNEKGKPTKRAVAENALDVCDGKLIWRIDSVQKLLDAGGVKAKRVYGNQEIAPPTSSEPTWVNLTTLATYFNVTPTAVGKWLDELELRDEDGLPTKQTQDDGLGQVSEMSAGKKKTRKIALWESYRVRVLLRDEGHPLDFDYMKSLAAKGKNSSVQVQSIDARAEEFAKGFVKVFKTGSRADTKAYVGKTPKAILMRTEVLLKKPQGWLSSGSYLERLR